MNEEIHPADQRMADYTRLVGHCKTVADCARLIERAAADQQLGDGFLVYLCGQIATYCLFHMLCEFGDKS